MYCPAPGAVYVHLMTVANPGTAMEQPNGATRSNFEIEQLNRPLEESRDGMQSLRLNVPASVQAGEKYALVLGAQSTLGESCVVRASSANTYSGGEEWTSPEPDSVMSAPFTKKAGDIAFKVLIRP